ncbi:MAG: hypothetical protein KAR65_02265 [Anaerolineales bacterium]|nr:hypothetical protein [Anaerolineales bacterium]
MKKNANGILLITLVSLLVGGCSVLSATSMPVEVPSPVPVSNATPSPAAEITFSVVPPAMSDPDSRIDIVLLDPVTGLEYNTYSIPMESASDGRWQVKIASPIGSQLYYRYARRSPTEAIEVNVHFEPIRTRVALVTGPLQINDVISAWSDVPFEGTTGRIIGEVLDASTGKGVPEIAVSAGGLITYSDGEGNFRLDDLPTGLHNVAIFSPNGAYRSIQQGAQVAADATTPVAFSLKAATSVLVTFQVTIPPGHDPTAQILLAGNISQLGNRFVDLLGNVRTSTLHMPSLVQIDPTHYLAVLTLYSGTDLRYKYTLGDGLWNSERDDEGHFVTRQVIIPEHETTLRDTVMSWNADEDSSIRFHVDVPENTPPGDGVSLQFKLGSWFEPLPMWQITPHEWAFELHGPVNFAGAVEYRYCRNLQCSSADDEDTAGPLSSGRILDFEQGSHEIHDQVAAWKWLETAPVRPSIMSQTILPRQGFEAGVDYLPGYTPTWKTTMPNSIQELPSLGVNAITLTPRWVITQQNPFPLLSFDPGRAAFKDELGEWVQHAKNLNLQVNLRPTISVDSSNMETWWDESGRDHIWWNLWFEEYRSFLLTFAQYAGDMGVEKLIINTHDIAPSLPSGQLTGGSSSGVPNDASERWEALILEIRERFTGRLSVEVELQVDALDLPPFVKHVDEISIYWRIPLTRGGSTEFNVLQTTVHQTFDWLLVQPDLKGKPVTISVEYLSIDGSANSCPPAPDGSCRDPEIFASGGEVDPDLRVDLIAQTEVINAMLLGAYERAEITGFYIRGYNPTARLHDKSASIYGKPAQELLQYFYPRITGMD